MTQVVVQVDPDGSLTVGKPDNMPDMFALGLLELAVHVMKRKLLDVRPLKRIEVPAGSVLVPEAEI